MDRSPANLTIIVLGAGKSGTSGLYAAIKEGLEMTLGHPLAGLFEPHTAKQIGTHLPRPFVVKMLLERLFRTDRALVDRFDRRVLIVRDPRDCLVSRLLWQCVGFAGFDTRAKAEQAIDLLRRKEAAPQSVSLIALYDAIGAIGGVPRWLRHAEGLAYLPLSLSWEEKAACHRIRYEDFVQGEVSALAAYLGFPLVIGALAPPPHGMTLRAAAFGDWRRWFTPVDAARFNDAERERLAALGYTDFAFVPHRDPLPAAEGSDYLLRLFRARRPELFASEG